MPVQRQKARSLPLAFLQANTSRLVFQLRGTNTTTKWRPPPQGILKCNVDAAFSKNKQLGAIARIIKDPKGQVITGKAKRIHTNSSVVAEA